MQRSAKIADRGNTTAKPDTADLPRWEIARHRLRGLVRLRGFTDRACCMDQIATISRRTCTRWSDDDRDRRDGLEHLLQVGCGIGEAVALIR